MKVKRVLNIYYKDYIWLDFEQRFDIVTYDLTESDKQVKVGEMEVEIDVVDYDQYPELLKSKQIEVLQRQQAALREKTLKELQELEERIQTLKGIEYTPE